MEMATSVLNRKFDVTVLLKNPSLAPNNSSAFMLKELDILGPI